MAEVEFLSNKHLRSHKNAELYMIPPDTPISQKTS